MHCHACTLIHCSLLWTVVAMWLALPVPATLTFTLWCTVTCNCKPLNSFFLKLLLLGHSMRKEVENSAIKWEEAEIIYSNAGRRSWWPLTAPTHFCVQFIAELNSWFLLYLVLWIQPPSRSLLFLLPTGAFITLVKKPRWNFLWQYGLALCLHAWWWRIPSREQQASVTVSHVMARQSIWDRMCPNGRRQAERRWLHGWSGREGKCWSVPCITQGPWY